MEQIIIRKSENGGFDVIQGKKYADGVTYDEALGLVSTLIMPRDRPCLCWMRTKEDHEARAERWRRRTPIQHDPPLLLLAQNETQTNKN